MSSHIELSPVKPAIGANKVTDAAILALGKEEQGWCNRVCQRTFFRVLLWLLIINGAGAFWLAWFVSDSLFWAINEEVFDFDFQLVTWISLITCGAGTLTLFCSGHVLLRSPEWFSRTWSAFFSGVPAAAMLFLAYGAG